MKKTSKDKKDTKTIVKSRTAVTKKGKSGAVTKPSAKKRIKDEEEEEDFVPLDDDLSTLDIYDDDDDEF